MNNLDAAKIKSPQTGFDALAASLLSPDNLMEDSTAYFKVQKQPNEKMLVKPEFPSAEERARNVEPRPCTFTSGSRSAIRAVFLPASPRLRSDSSSSLSNTSPLPNSSQFLQRLYLMADFELTWYGKSNCLKVLGAMSEVLKTDNVTFSAPYKYNYKTSAQLSNIDLSPNLYGVSSNGNINITLNLVTPVTVDSMKEQQLETSTDLEKGGDAAQTSTTAHAGPAQEPWRMKHGPRFFMPATANPLSLELNEIVSWITGFPCYGDAIFAFVEPTEMQDVNYKDLLSLMAAYTPVGLMFADLPVIPAVIPPSSHPFPASISSPIFSAESSPLAMEKRTAPNVLAPPPTSLLRIPRCLFTATSRGVTARSAISVLEEMAAKRGWAKPGTE